MKNMILSLSLLSLTAGAQTIPTVIGTTTTDVKISQLTLVYIAEHPDRVTIQGSDFGAGRLRSVSSPLDVFIRPTMLAPCTVNQRFPF